MPRVIVIGDGVMAGGHTLTRYRRITRVTVQAA